MKAEYEPMPFLDWRAANPDLCTEEECDTCDGEGRVEDDCSCEEYGNQHTAEHDCKDCDGTGLFNGGGQAEYRTQMYKDQDRWAEEIYRVNGPVEVFVFGSNREGRHGAGAAKRAVKAYGAILGRAEGRQGRAYAIVTKELRPHQPPVTLAEVARGVLKFLDYARGLPRERFLVTKIGGGLAGFDWERQVRPLFDGRPENVVLLEDRRA